MRQVAIFAVCVLTLTVFSVARAQESTPVPGPEATISALQTQVAELEAMLTPTVAPTTEVADSDQIETFGVYGPVIEDLKPGKDGALSLLARGKYQEGAVAVVVRNNTEKTYSTVDVSGEVRDANGKVTQVVNGLQFYPSPIPPGGLALGQVYFDQPVNEGDQVKLKVKGTELSSFSLDSFPLELVEYNVLEDGRVTGSVRNNSEQTTTNRGYTILMCFNEGTNPVWSDIGSIDEGLAPGEVAAFEFGQFGGIPVSCDRYLFAAYSYT